MADISQRVLRLPKHNISEVEVNKFTEICKALLMPDDIFIDCDTLHAQWNLPAKPSHRIYVSDSHICLQSTCDAPSHMKDCGTVWAGVAWDFDDVSGIVSYIKSNHPYLENDCEYLPRD